MKRGLVLVALAALACGGDEAQGNSCALSLVVTGADAPPPTTLVVSADITVYGNVVGFQAVEWDIRFEGAPVDWISRSEGDDTVIELVASSAGPYDISATGQVGSMDCISAETVANVLNPGASSASYTLRVIPPTGPEHVQSVAVFGGADTGLSPIDLASEVRTVGIRDAGGGVLDAFVRVLSSDTTRVLYETWTTSGDLELSIGAGDLDIEVIPDGPAAPFVARGLSAENLPAILLAPSSQTISATVTAGGPLAGARVRAIVDDGPASLATTDGAGHAQVAVAQGTSNRIEIVPPIGSSWPQLRVPAASGIPSAVTATMPTLDTRTVGLTLESAGGDPLSAALVQLVSEPLPAGTVDRGSGLESAEAVFSRSFVADDTGQVGPITLPSARYQIAVAGPAGAGLIDLDLRTGQPDPGVLSVPAAVTTQGTVTRGTAPASNVAIVARPLDRLAGLGLLPTRATSGLDGSFSLAVAPGEPYELVATPPPGNDGPVRRVFDSGDSPLLELPLAVRLRGRVQRFPLAVAGAHVLLFDDASAEPIAWSITDDDGRFTLIVPDPGTE